MLRGNNFFHAVIAGIAIPAQSIGQSVTVNGTAISEPWRSGRQITFVLVGGDIGAAATATCTVQGLRRSDGTTWEALKGNDGVTDLAFTPSKLADTGALENGVILGTVDMSRIDGATYKSLRLVFVRGAEAVASLVGAAYIISDLYKHPSGQVDDLFAETNPT